MAEVTLKGVYKFYEKTAKPAVSDFNLDIQDKEFVVFVGPSGCGKSTTLRMIAGLEQVTFGEIAIDGRVVNDVEPKDRDIAMVFQNYALYPHMTVFQNMAFGLNMARVPKEAKDKDGKVMLHEDGTPVYETKRNRDGSVKLDDGGQPEYKTRKYTKAEIEAKVREAAKILDITQFLDRKPSQLSGGQRQRVAIGRSIVRNPKVFLFDEPLSNLDAKLRNQMRAEIIALRRKINTTFIYVTHDQVEAMTLGDKVVIMKDGVIHQVGSPAELFDHPANLFVAGFIGAPQMNYFHAELSEKSGRVVVEAYGKFFPVKETVGSYLKEHQLLGKRVILGVRPEHITLVSKKDSANDMDTICADIAVSEMMGSELYIHANIAGAQEIVIRVPTISLSPTERANIDALGRIAFTFSPEVMHLFDEETENNLIPMNLEENSQK